MFLLLLPIHLIETKQLFFGDGPPSPPHKTFFLLEWEFVAARFGLFFSPSPSRRNTFCPLHLSSPVVFVSGLVIIMRLLTGDQVLYYGPFDPVDFSGFLN